MTYHLELDLDSLTGTVELFQEISGRTGDAFRYVQGVVAQEEKPWGDDHTGETFEKRFLPSAEQWSSEMEELTDTWRVFGSHIAEAVRIYAQSDQDAAQDVMHHDRQPEPFLDLPHRAPRTSLSIPNSTTSVSRNGRVQPAAATPYSAETTHTTRTSSDTVPTSSGEATGRPLPAASDDSGPSSPGAKLAEPLTAVSRSHPGDDNHTPEHAVHYPAGHPGPRQGFTGDSPWNRADTPDSAPGSCGPGNRHSPGPLTQRATPWSTLGSPKTPDARTDSSQRPNFSPVRTPVGRGHRENVASKRGDRPRAPSTATPKPATTLKE